MRLRMFAYICQEVFSSLRRNSWLNLAAVSTTTISLLILGVFVLLYINTNHLATMVESDVELVLYLDEDLSKEAASLLELQIKRLPSVQEVKFITKEEALSSLEKQMGKGELLQESLGGVNPLPDAYKIRTEEPRQVVAVANACKQLPGVETVRYGQGIVEKLFKITDWVRAVSLSLIGLLGVCAIFLIATTIRLTMFSRRKEITIMKYVGATDWFVRWPFLLEGVILGGLGAFIAITALYFSYNALILQVREVIVFLSLVQEPYMLYRLFGSLLGIGVGLGLMGSVISIHRYLKV